MRTLVTGLWELQTGHDLLLCPGWGVLWGCQAKLWFLASLARQEATSDLLWLGHWHTQTGQQKCLHGTQGQAVNLGVSFKFSSSSASSNPNRQLVQCPTPPGLLGTDISPAVPDPTRCNTGGCPPDYHSCTLSQNRICPTVLSRGMILPGVQAQVHATQCQQILQYLYPKSPLLCH